jgi:cytochrome c oxidase assembly factor CtaG
MSPGMAMAGMSPWADGAQMIAMGLTMTVACPLLVVAVRRRGWLRSLRLRPVWTLVAFFFSHSFITLAMADDHATWVQVTLWVAMLPAGFAFYQPVFGARRMSDAARCVYLFTSGPCLDLAAVALIVIFHDAVGGIGMIVGMLPLGLTAMVTTWRWALREEREAAVADVAAGWQARGAVR